jgi:beta-fructofuranosidase
MNQDRRSFLKSLGCGTAGGLLVAHGHAARIGAANGAWQEQASEIKLDPLRPEYHLMPQHNWMNDPNGPIWWKGQYHLFYQLNPHAAVWGDMHWGHAVSPDMIHWKHEPIALAPTPGGADSEGCFSGSAVVFDAKPAIIYTGVENAPPSEITLRDGNDKLRETQMLAIAEDDQLLHWKKLETPVIAAPPQGMVVTGFRDPCPWREGETWYLGVGSGERGVGGCVLLYRSKDLRHWEYLHKLVQGKPNGKVAVNPCDSGEMWECPDFFAVDGHYVLLYSTEDKVLWTTGEYDARGHRYIPMRTGLIDQGSYYAPKSFLAPDGRRILWGWIRETRPEAEFAAAGWSGAMGLPRVLTVNRDGQLEMKPAAEVEKIRRAVEAQTLAAQTPFRQKLATLRRELHIPLSAPAQKIAVRLLTHGEKVWELVVDVPGSLVTCGDTSFALPRAPWADDSLRIFLDGSVIESYIVGREALTSRVYNVAPDSTELVIEVLKGQSVDFKSWELEAISPDRLTT